MSPAFAVAAAKKLEFRRRGSIATTWALAMRRRHLLHPGQPFAGAEHHHAQGSDDDTIMGGVIYLYTSGSWPLALMVLIASVMIPLGKLVSIAYLLISVQRGSVKSSRERTRLYRIVVIIGRWSMLDVFVDTFTVAMVQLQPLMSVQPGRACCSLPRWWC